MIKRTVLCCLLSMGLSLAVSAGDAPALSRTLQFKLSGLVPSEKEDLDLYYSATKDSDVYYMGFVSSTDPDAYSFDWNGLTFAKLSPVEGAPDSYTLTLLLQDDGHYISALITHGMVSVSAYGKADYSWDGALSLGDDQAKYWFPFTTTSVESGSAQMEIVGSLMARPGKSEGIADPLVAVGPMDFRPCDGCEHGDQMIIDPGHGAAEVNVVNLVPSKYYEMDCEGTVQPILQSLMDSDVAFTYSGLVTSVGPDYWEGDFWVATGSNPDLKVGDHGKLTILELLDQVVAATGTADVKFGKVHAIDKNRLVGKFPGGTVSVNLRTGKIKVSKGGSLRDVILRFF
jgi:hypothetical protein